MAPINFGISPLGRAVRKITDSVVTFLFRDDFTTNESAPLTSPRTAEPGLGVLNIYDTENKLAITNSELKNTGGAGFSNPHVVESVLHARTVGMIAMWRILAVSTTDVGISLGHVENPADISGTRTNLFLFFPSQTYILPLPLVNLGLDFVLDYDIYYDVVLIEQTNGFLHIMKFSNEWRLLWVSVNYLTNPLAMWWGIAQNGCTSQLDFMRRSQSDEFLDYAIATQRLAGAINDSEPYIHEADCIVEFEATTLPNSGSHIFVAFRLQSAGNAWLIKIELDGKIRLVEYVSAVQNDRIVSSTGVVSNGDRVVVIADDEVIKLYVDNVLIGTYSNAVNFKTATAGAINIGTGAVSDFISWPRTLSGTAKDALDAVADA